jgi:hypothetical protein
MLCYLILRESVSTQLVAQVLFVGPAHEYLVLVLLQTVFLQLAFSGTRIDSSLFDFKYSAGLDALH